MPAISPPSAARAASTCATGSDGCPGPAMHAAARRSVARSPATTQPRTRSGASRNARAMISGPMPAASPIVIASGRFNAMSSCRVVDVDEFVRQAELRRDVARHRRRAVALARVVAAGEVGHAAFARDVRLRLGNLAGDEGLRPGGDCRLEVALRAAGAPRYSFDSTLRRIHQHDLAIQPFFQMRRECARVGKRTAVLTPPEKAQALLAEAARRTVRSR